MADYIQLDPQQLVETLERLHQRLTERFPNAGLTQLGGQLVTVSRAASERAAWIARPIWGLRAIVYLLMVAVVCGMAYGVIAIVQQLRGNSGADLVQGLEAGANLVVLVGVASLFLVSLERRMKRKRALQALDELRSVVHIIDMHQLTKDPDRLQPTHQATGASPKMELNRAELQRYLDYCSELLSLCGKIAALYVQHFEDAVVLSTVNDLETLATSLSQKIWQKITILNTAT